MNLSLSGFNWRAIMLIVVALALAWLTATGVAIPATWSIFVCLLVASFVGEIADATEKGRDVEWGQPILYSIGAIIPALVASVWSQTSILPIAFAVAVPIVALVFEWINNALAGKKPDFGLEIAKLPMLFLFGLIFGLSNLVFGVVGAVVLVTFVVYLVSQVGMANAHAS